VAGKNEEQLRAEIAEQAQEMFGPLLNVMGQVAALEFVAGGRTPEALDKALDRLETTIREAFEKRFPIKDPNHKAVLDQKIKTIRAAAHRSIFTGTQE